MIGDSLATRVSSYADIQGIDLTPYDTGVAGLAVFRSRILTALTPCLIQTCFLSCASGE